MRNQRNHFRVRVHTKDGPETGTLTWDDKGPSIKTPVEVFSKGDDVFYDIDTELIPGSSVTPRSEIGEPIATVRLHPLIMTNRRFSYDQIIATDQVYPPASHNWTSRISHAGKNVVVSIQPTLEPSKYWLTVLNPELREVLESHLIHRYEVGAIGITSDNEEDVVRRTVVAPKSLEEMRDDILKVLEEPPPTWKSITELTEGVNIPNLRRGSSMREFLEQLVPESFSETLREELMVFLAFVVKKEFPKEDPADIFFDLLPMRVLRSLLSGHIHCMVDNVNAPSYVKILHLAEKKQLGNFGRPPHGDAERDPWLKAWYRIVSLFPSYSKVVINTTLDLNDSGKIHLQLPISRDEARRSRAAWNNRLALLTESVSLRGLVNVNAIGLGHLLYLGHAHGWPHKHLSFTSRLEADTERTLHFDVMVMPKAAVQKVLRVRPSVVEIGWMNSETNLLLFDEKEKTWKTSVKRLLNSIRGKRSLRQLQNEFGMGHTKRFQKVSRDEARALDLASYQLYLSQGESDGYWKYWRFTKKTLQTKLEDLRDRGILKVSYRPILQNLNSILTFAQGDSNTICSLTRAFLKNTPSTTAYLQQDAKTCFLLSRLPRDKAGETTRSLTTVGHDAGLRVRCFPMTWYSGYNHNLFSRLLRDDGSWDDDVEDLLSQIRVPYQE